MRITGNVSSIYKNRRVGRLSLRLNNAAGSPLSEGGSVCVSFPLSFSSEL